MNDYARLHALSRQIKILSTIHSMLAWDQETYMPHQSADFRGDQIKTIAGLIHKEKTSSGFSRALGRLIDLKSGEVLAKDLSPAQNAAVKEWHRIYKRHKALPKKLVEDLAKLTAEATEAWRESKQNKDFKLFLPFLDKIVQINQKKCELYGYQDHPYDALLEAYEPDMKTAQIDPLFKVVRAAISQLVHNIARRPPADNKILYGDFSLESQIAFSKRLLKDMGFDLNKGRLDFSEHPFSCTFHPTDSRITTTCHPGDPFTKNISAVMHECGHSLYSMSLPLEHFGSPLGEPASMAMDESQSRWWETRIGLSKPFWKYYFPLVQEQFPKQLKKVSLEQFYKAINKVNPSFIRVEADEVTYPLHVILRYEIERALIEGSLNVKEVPDAWNAKMKELLGVEPSNDSEGCLQDIHWAHASFGYFPSYTLGNMYTAHLFEKFELDHADWKTRVEKGELLFIHEWLNQAIYQHGRRYKSGELLQKVTGKPFTADAYIRYLTGKYEQ